MNEIKDYIIPNQKMEFFIEDKRGYKRRCSGEFNGTIRNLGYKLSCSDFSHYDLGIEMKLYTPCITITISEEDKQYIEKIEKLEKELKDLKNMIQANI